MREIWKVQKVLEVRQVQKVEEVWEFLKFQVVRKVLVVWIQLVRGSDLSYSQFVFLRIGGFFNFSGNLGLMKSSHALVAKSLNWFLIWLPTCVWVFFTFALYFCGLKPAWSLFSWINCQSLLIHSHWPSSLIIFCLPEKSGSKDYNYFMLDFFPNFDFKN